MSDKKYAIRRLVRNPSSGRMNVVFTDTRTGSEVSDLSGYEVIESKGFMSLEDLGIDPVSTPNMDPSVSQEIVNSNTTPQQNIGEGGRESQQRGSGAPRDPVNNFGFIEKPGFLNAASFVPGMIGTGAKLANVGINMNNAAAVGAARQSIGLEDDRGFFGRAMETVRDNKGYVADIQYDDGMGRQRTTPVSLKAEDPVGRTTLTPTEARTRNMLNPVEVAPRDEVKDVRQAFKDASPNSARQGMVTKAFDSLRSVTANIMDTVLGNNTKTVAQAAVQTAARNSTTDSGSTTQFAEKSPNQDMSVASQYGSYGAGKKGDSFGGSSQADAARDNPGGGLY